MIDKIFTAFVKQWGRNLFMEPILLLAFILSFAISLWRHKREKERIVFSFYFALGILLFSVVNILSAVGYFPTAARILISEPSNIIFELVEFIAFYCFFKRCLQSKNFQKVLNIFLILLFLAAVSFLLMLISKPHSIEVMLRYSLLINVIEFLFLFFMCLAYFFELFTTVPKTGLLQRPSFLIVSSTLFYSVIPIPFFLMGSHLFKNEKSIYDDLVACHYFLLTIMLLTISRAFLRKVPITT